MLQESDSPQTFYPGDSPDFQVVPISPIQDYIDETLAESVDKVYKEIDAIYLNQPEDIFSELDAISKPEVIVSPASRELYALADEIIKARKELLDRTFFSNAI